MSSSKQHNYGRVKVFKDFRLSTTEPRWSASKHRLFISLAEITKDCIPIMQSLEFFPLWKPKIGVYFIKECDFWAVLVRYIGELNILKRKMHYTKTLRFHEADVFLCSFSPSPDTSLVWLANKVISPHKNSTLLKMHCFLDPLWMSTRENGVFIKWAPFTRG